MKIKKIDRKAHTHDARLLILENNWVYIARRLLDTVYFCESPLQKRPGCKKCKSLNNIERDLCLIDWYNLLLVVRLGKAIKHLVKLIILRFILNLFVS